VFKLAKIEFEFTHQIT